LRDLGYVEGQNLTVEYGLAAGDFGRLPAMAGELLRLPVDIIIADGTKSAQVAHEATRAIPIVGVAFGPDPVAAGLVNSFAHPGGNITGFVGLNFELRRISTAYTLPLIFEQRPQQLGWGACCARHLSGDTWKPT
jgi:ABC-type uncharacterized transport system substrate-binding protein